MGGVEVEVRASRRKEIAFIEPQLDASSSCQDTLFLLNPQEKSLIFAYSGKRGLVDFLATAIIKKNFLVLVFQLVFI